MLCNIRDSITFPPTAYPRFVAGIVGAGLCHSNVALPNVSNGDNAVLTDIGGRATQPNVFLTVQR